MVSQYRGHAIDADELPMNQGGRASLNGRKGDQSTMPTQRDLSGTTALVTGASRGFGRAIAEALTDAGATVVGVARDPARLEAVRAQLGERFVAEPADAADPTAVGRLMDAYGPSTLVLNAGAVSLVRPLEHHTWETFSVNW
jgi:NADP-dependent 3-hydroxy acid dehydrogenase YdfG